MSPALALMERIGIVAYAALTAIAFAVAPVLAFAAMAHAPALAAAAFVFAVYLLAGIVVATRRGFGHVHRSLERIAGGDLSQRGSDVSGDGDLARLDASVNAMKRNLLDIVKQVRETADSIAQGATRASGETADLASRTEEQAATLEHSAAGMQELAATIRQNAQSCTNATKIAADAAQSAQGVASKMLELQAMMQVIEKSSREAADITRTVEQISFQTNLLALNAAVEAARAGEQGRGFAVVASEVRTLAARAAEAAKQIKSVCASSVGNAARGLALADQSGTSMQSLLGNVTRVDEVIREIAQASAQQRDGVEALNRSVVQLDAMTQQNAQMVQRAAASTARFESEAHRLIETVGAFKTDRMEARDAAVALVKKAVAHTREVGVAQANIDFERLDGGFIDADAYVYTIDFEGTRLASGADPSLKGQNILDLRDVDGRLCMRDIIHIVKTRGRGWYDYKWMHPRKRTVEMKSVYFEAVDGMIIISGIYKSDNGA